MEKFLPSPGENCSVSIKDARVHLLLYKLYANVAWFKKKCNTSVQNQSFPNRSLFTEIHLAQSLRLMGKVTLLSCLQAQRQQLCLNCPSAWLDTNSDGRKIISYYPRQSSLEYRDAFEWSLFSKDFHKLRDCVWHWTLHNLLSFPYLFKTYLEHQTQKSLILFSPLQLNLF